MALNFELYNTEILRTGLKYSKTIIIRTTIPEYHHQHQLRQRHRYPFSAKSTILLQPTKRNKTPRNQTKNVSKIKVCMGINHRSRRRRSRRSSNHPYLEEPREQTEEAAILRIRCYRCLQYHKTNRASDGETCSRIIGRDEPLKFCIAGFCDDDYGFLSS